MKQILLILTFFICNQLPAQTGITAHPWFDHSKSFDERIDLLISAMTLEEKASQMMHESKAIPRLGIPEYNWWGEALHGLARSAKATVFPQSMGLAATFDVELMKRVGSVISDEARAVNNEMIRLKRPFKRYMGLTFWSPNVNIYRDPRWGRGQETYGEDPFLGGSMGAAFIKGMQGDDPKYLKVAACAKHFAVHSGPEGQRHGFNAIANKKDMYETYFPAFKLCVDAGVEAVMCAYNRTNDLPCCGSTPLLRDVLRNEWGFEGHIVSDCGAIKDFHKGHFFTKSSIESSVLALKNGVNLNCGKNYINLPEAVEKGLISEKMIDVNLKTLLRTKFKLGMFDPPSENPYSKIGIEVINSDTHKALALEAARKSIVLLQNKNNILPLKKDLGFVYITGPLAERTLALVGNYNGLSPEMPTILEGIIKKVSPITRVEYRVGSLLSTPNLNTIDWQTGLTMSADATIAVVGLTVLQEGEDGETIATDQLGDNLDMQLPKSQLDFLRKVKKRMVDNNKHRPLIVVVCAGSPINMTEIKEIADVIIYGWYPGEQGGNAVADIIFGDVSPSGKLPVTFPKSAEDLPAYNDYSMKGRTYKYMEKTPDYPFGFGLSYTKFKLSEISLSNTVVEKNRPITATIRVENTGKVNSDEVIQMYLSLKGVEENIPISELKSFKRIPLAPGETAEVTMEISSDIFTYINDSGEKEQYRGNAEIYMGNASPGSRSIELGAVIQKTAIIVK